MPVPARAGLNRMAFVPLQRTVGRPGRLRRQPRDRARFLVEILTPAGAPPCSPATTDARAAGAARARAAYGRDSDPAEVLRPPGAAGPAGVDADAEGLQLAVEDVGAVAGAVHPA